MPRSDTLRPLAIAPGVVDAQLLGRDGSKRGLREGAPALERARTAYLSTEWSGPHDRRPETGLLTRARL